MLFGPSNGAAERGRLARDLNPEGVVSIRPRHFVCFRAIEPVSSSLLRRLDPGATHVIPRGEML
ncbi:MAG: hypothetical protein DMG04_26805 [Acidobacteria bacterium]|nr:MAG: hypothetical protein DMG04_26805 [Acidobacteriota bacterium]PYQ86389.1 MAG: hypothetical protein DMG02_25265 [Acidobacteriota bacterium]PYQ88955.1 MAG: hypothetical protein DMG03_02790 [Acidobacteriota bacterium]PYR07431.1 MAG: hypothetical protein DMF99_22675 [Acidobacteriota bacterium]